ncbi:MAG: hypothetical protein FJ304_17485 [Planctomycetes bacterium]|nr:hypothetical protein [Planctomycetota bacterium]
MDAPEPPPAAPPPEPAPVVAEPPARRRVTRRGLLKLAGGLAGLGVFAEFLRVSAFTNVHTVVPGRVYRTAQLSAARLSKFIAEKGVRTVVNLRGVCKDMSWYVDECHCTLDADISMEDITFSAKRFPAPSELQRLIDVLDHTAYPIVIHCQRGADRTGLAATVVRLLQSDDDLPTARRQLWPRYGHYAVGRTAILDVVFDYYAEWLKARGEGHAPERFRRWVANDYCPGPFRAKLELVGPVTFAPGRGFVVGVRATNTSVEPWRFDTGRMGGVRLRYTVIAESDGTTARRAYVGTVARAVHPGESIEFACGLPPLPAGTYSFHADLLDAQTIEYHHSDFAQYGSEPLASALIVR